MALFHYHIRRSGQADPHISRNAGLPRIAPETYINRRCRSGLSSAFTACFQNGFRIQALDAMRQYPSVRIGAGLAPLPPSRCPEAPDIILSSPKWRRRLHGIEPGQHPVPFPTAAQRHRNIFSGIGSKGGPYQDSHGLPIESDRHLPVRTMFPAYGRW